MTSLVPLSNKDQWERMISQFPGREAVLDPIPVDRVINVLMQQIETFSQNYMGHFDPRRPILGLILYEAVRVLSTWIQRTLRFRSWSYQLLCFFDSSIEVLSLELMAVRRNLPIRLCLLDQEIDTFDPRLDMFHYMAFTPKEFVEVVNQNLLEVNETIQEWNEMCSKYKPVFDYELPAGKIIPAILETIEDQVFYPFIPSTEIELYDVFRSFGEIPPIVFGGAWEFLTEFKESGEWMRIRSFLRNLYYDRLTFVLKEEVGATYNAMDSVRVETSLVEEFVVEHVHGCMLSMNLWNRMLEGGYPLSGQPIG